MLEWSEMRSKLAQKQKPFKCLFWKSIICSSFYIWKACEAYTLGFVCFWIICVCFWYQKFWLRHVLSYIATEAHPSPIMPSVWSLHHLISPSCFSTFSFSAGELIQDGSWYICIYAFDHWTTWPEVNFNLLLGDGWEEGSLHISICPCILCEARTILLNTWITSMSHHTPPNHIISFIFCAFSFKLSKPYPYPLSCCLCACLYLCVFSKT